MREIKFRAWHKEHKKIYPIAGLFLDGSVILLQHGDTLFTAQPNKIELMQYIGRKDKNGKEIYKGDLAIDDWMTPKEVCYEVYWNDDLAMWDLRDRRTGRRYWESHGGPIYWDHLEVVGNIYEDPDRFEVKL